MFRVAANALPSSSGSFDHRIDRFEVARIRRKTNLHFRARSELPHRAVTKVIFYVTIAANQLWNVILCELRKDHFE